MRWTKYWVGLPLLALACNSAILAPGLLDDTDTGTTTGGGGPETAQITHSFGVAALKGFEEIQPCVSWTLDNEEPVYVSKVTLSNGGAFHHSNWFVVPETEYAGDDGFWWCGDRGYGEIQAAAAGTVIFAQSTQSWLEEQEFNEGVVIKVPPHHKVVAQVHLLNLSPREMETELRMSLDIIHPKNVDVALTPFRLTYLDLDIPKGKTSHFTGTCDSMWTKYDNVSKHPFDLKLHYVLPHYHYLGNFFELEVMGGPKDGEVLYTLDGFNAEGNGKTFADPVDLTGADGFKFTCGYYNWRDKDVGWGIGDNEMCVMLGLAEAHAVLDASVLSGSIAEAEGDFTRYEGGCFTNSIPKSAGQTPPTAAEVDAPLYVPPADPADDGLPAVPDCVDADPSAAPHEPTTLTSIKDTIFVPACQFSACHGNGGTSAGLDLSSADLHAALMNHPLDASTDKPLIAPGDPEGSWLYESISRCEPKDKNGAVRAHMPRNAPVLLDDDLVAKVRVWIAAGAQND